MTGFTSRLATRAIPSSYQQWNEALAERFFPEGQAQPVYLDPDDAALAEVAGTIGATGDPVDAFVESVKETLWLQQPSRFLHWHDEWFRDWRSSGRAQTPTVVALLALFSFASTRMEDDRAYYKPLCKLLAVRDVDGISRCYNARVRYYWSALNAWIESSRRGIPTAYPQDARANVSLLLTQRFLSAAERAMLLAFFALSGLTPGTSLTMPEMEDHIRRMAHHLPTELTGEWHRHPDRFAEVSAIELESWTGQHEGTNDGTAEAPLLLGLYFDRRREGVQFPFATSSAAAPSGEYYFEGAPDESRLIQYAIDELGGAVTFDADDGLRFSRGPRLSAEGIAAILDEDVEIATKAGFGLRRKQSDVALFLPLSANSYLEAPGRRLPLGTRFTLLANAKITLEPTFSKLTAGAQPLAIDGCPQDWRLYRDVELRVLPESPGEGLPAELQRLLPLAHDAVIDLRGGIPLAGPTRAGRAWLAYRLPEIVVSGPEEDIEAQLHLRPSDGAEGTIESLTRGKDGAFLLPANGSSLPSGDHQLFIVRGSKTLAQKKLRVVSSNTPRAEFRGLAHADVTGWHALSAGQAQEARTSVRGARWAELEQANGEFEQIYPPASLKLATTPIEEAEDEHAALGVMRDIRPEMYRRRRRPRRRAILHALGNDSSLPDLNGPELAEAAGSGAETFVAADGKTWCIRYFENGEIVVRPPKGFVPLARFRLSRE
jgi:hypothetical protein